MSRPTGGLLTRRGHRVPAGAVPPAGIEPAHKV